MGLELLLPLMIIVLLVLMFMQSSKQRRAMKELRKMQESLAAGDHVLTTSGLHATIVGVDTDTLELEIAPGIRTRWDRRVIREKFDTSAAPETGSGTDASGSR